MKVKGGTLSGDLMELSSALKTIVRQEIRAGAGAPTLTQFRILHAVRRGVRHVGKLSETFGISQPATSIMVDAMVRGGYLKRAASPGDRRRVELRLTPKAERSLDTTYARAFARLDRKLLPLSAAKRAQMGRSIRELTRLLAR